MSILGAIDLPRKCNLCAFTVTTPCSIIDNYHACQNWAITREANTMTQATPPEIYNTPRSRLLNEVMEIVHKDRNANYGNPEDNFSQIAGLWNVYLGTRKKASVDTTLFITSADVAIMNMLIKVARLAKNPNHHDSAVDIAGYAACLADIQESASKVAVGQAKT